MLVVLVSRLGLRLCHMVEGFAMLVWPVSRSRLIARLRMLAIMRGPLPVRTWDRSSPLVTSRTLLCTMVG